LAATLPVPERQARADLFRFLAACYYEPAAEFAEERLFDSMAEAAASVDLGLAEAARRLGKAFATEPLEDLLVDYARLFLGPPQALAQPYASSWLPAGDPGTSVLTFYEEAGFAVSDDFRDLPDHIAAELEVLYLLVHQDGWEGMRTRFVDEHLGRWIGPFANAISANAGTEFYRQLAALSRRAVALEQASRVAA
jgi:putative dimethyl sulfoxide reductase chaperone